MRFATLTDHLADDKPTAIDRAADIGFDGIELVVPDGVHDVGSHGMALDPDHPPVETDPVWSATARADLRERAASADLAITSLCPSFMNMQPGLTAPDPADRASARTLLMDLIDVAADLGADTILVPFFVEAAIETDEDRERVVDSLRDLAPTAAQVDVTLAIETTLNAPDNRELLEAVDHPAVAIYYDVANVLNYGYDPAEELRALDEHVQQVHLKDFDEAGTHALLGEGCVEFDAVAMALTEIGYDRWIALETSYVSDPIESMEKNLAFARELVGEHC